MINTYILQCISTWFQMILEEAIVYKVSSPTQFFQILGIVEKQEPWNTAVTSSLPYPLSMRYLTDADFKKSNKRYLRMFARLKPTTSWKIVIHLSHTCTVTTGHRSLLFGNSSIATNFRIWIIHCYIHFCSAKLQLLTIRQYPSYWKKKKSTKCVRVIALTLKSWINKVNHSVREEITAEMFIYTSVLNLQQCLWNYPKIVKIHHKIYFTRNITTYLRTILRCVLSCKTKGSQWYLKLGSLKSYLKTFFCNQT
jgi:hypothetical protein